LYSLVPLFNAKRGHPVAGQSVDYPHHQTDNYDRADLPVEHEVGAAPFVLQPGHLPALSQFVSASRLVYSAMG
jgi:hypothetical protein